MHYQSEVFQLNSLRLGLIHEDNIHGKPTIFFTIASQLEDSKVKIEKYQKLITQDYNCIAIPFDIDDGEPGDNYDIIQFYENILNIDFYVTEKLTGNHLFFETFGTPDKNFTEYHFDANTKFIGKHYG